MGSVHRLVAQLPPVHVLNAEYERLADIICASPLATDGLALLWSELMRAAVINPEDAPADLVRMNSVVRYTVLQTGVQRIVRLVYVGKESGDVQITTTLGAALIGLHPGATFVWKEDGVTRAIRIEAVGPTPLR